MDEQSLISQLAERLNGKVVLSAEINESDLTGNEIGALAAKITAYFEGKGGLKILDLRTLDEIKKIDEKKEPVRIEVIRPDGFRPEAKEVEARFSVRNAKREKTFGTVSDFAGYFRDRLRRIKSMIESSPSSGGTINSIDKLAQYANGREVSLVGMVYEKVVTKKGNIMVTLDDETGSTKVIFSAAQKGASKAEIELFESAKRIVNDEVIGVYGKIWSPFLIAKKIMWPDVPIRSRKKIDEDISIAFTSDVHIGSKLFLENQFGKFLEWLNGGIDAKKDLAGRIKYLVISGDLVDGIGVYPSQDRELSISDIYKQYAVLIDFLSSIPDYIHIFILPGNHDAVQSSEPQPELGKELIGELAYSNIHLVSNPGYMTLNGMKVLGYHGTSLDSIIQSIPGCSYSKPESAMVEVLKRRHISPIYGDNPVTPAKRDSMVIDEVPDILHMGHVHKNGYTDYHGTQVINSGTWQARTLYQVKLGHLPTPAVLPVYDCRQGNLWTVDFNNM